MLRRLAVSSFVLTAFSLGAVAADLPSRKEALPPVSPLEPTPVYSWDGFYLGANAGETWDQSTLKTFTSGGFLTDPNAVPYQAAYNANLGNGVAGFTGGATAGFNKQFGVGLIGLEADINYRRDMNNWGILTVTDAPLPAGVISKTFAQGGDDWFGTLRARLGLTADRALFFASAGLALGNTRSTTLYTTTAPVYSWSGAQSSVRLGWTVGGGFEYAIDDHWTAKVEYLYVNLGGPNYTLQNAVANPLQTYTLGGRSSDIFHVARLGLNYKFKEGASAVIARY